MSTPSTAMATRNGQPAVQAAALAIQPYQEMFTDKQKAALAALGIKDASPADLAVFMHYCQKTGLDPFSRQIYLIMRREKVNGNWVPKQTIQVGIDGFRVIRDRIADRQGIAVEYEDTIWYDASGQATDVWLSPEPPAACRVVVLRDGRRFPAVVRTAAYAQTNQQGEMVSQWRTQPDHMIEKCAEAFALRRAFPNDLGGMYIEEEVRPADPAAPPAGRGAVSAQEIAGRRISTARATVVRDEPREPAERPAAPAAEDAPADTPARPTGAALGKLGKLLGQLSLTAPEDMAIMLPWLTGRDGVAGLEALTRDEAAKITKALDGILRSHGDAESAAAMLWARYHEDTAGEAPSQDGEAVDG